MYQWCEVQIEVSLPTEYTAYYKETYYCISIKLWFVAKCVRYTFSNFNRVQTAFSTVVGHIFDSAGIKHGQRLFAVFIEIIVAYVLFVENWRCRSVGYHLLQKSKITTTSSNDNLNHNYNKQIKDACSERGLI